MLNLFNGREKKKRTETVGMVQNGFSSASLGWKDLGDSQRSDSAAPFIEQQQVTEIIILCMVRSPYLPVLDRTDSDLEFRIGFKSDEINENRYPCSNTGQSVTLSVLEAPKCSEYPEVSVLETLHLFEEILSSLSLMALCFRNHKTIRKPCHHNPL